MSGVTPCKDCPERFTACSGRCPKDARGEYGYLAWKADLEAKKKATKLQIGLDMTASKRRARWAYAKRYHSG